MTREEFVTMRPGDKVRIKEYSANYHPGHCSPGKVYTVGVVKSETFRLESCDRETKCYANWGGYPEWELVSDFQILTLEDMKNAKTLPDVTDVASYFGVKA